MRIAKIEIEKFRSISKALLEIDEILALVGQNGSGKSSILRALNCFFNTNEERQFIDRGEHAFNSRSNSLVTIWFRDIPESIESKYLYDADSLGVRMKFRKSIEWTYWDGSHWESIPSKGSDIVRIIKDSIQFIYVPTRRDHSVANDAAEGLVGKILDSWLHVRIGRDTYSKPLSDIAERFADRVLSSVESELARANSANDGISFVLRHTKSLSIADLIDGVEVAISQGNGKYPLRDAGSGTQGMAVYALISLLAGLSGKTFVLGYEEPEQNLHPQSQRQLIRNLRGGASTQVLITTHSPTVVDMLTHEEVAICRRGASAKHKRHISEVRQLDGGFFDRFDIDRNQYYKFHRRNNSEFFFASSVILTEGDTDAEVVTHLLRAADCDPEEFGATVISLDAVNQVPTMYHLLRHLEIPVLSIVDKDYFLPYKHESGELDKSRGTDGFPRYRREWNASCVFVKIFEREFEQLKLMNLLHSNHSKAMRHLQRYGIVCFNYNLEMDLVGSSSVRSFYAEEFGAADDTSKTILVGYKKKIKKIETIIPALDATPVTGLPNSYKRIRREVSRFIMEHAIA